MKLALVSCALIAGALTASPMQGRLADTQIFKADQQVMPMAPVAASLTIMPVAGPVDADMDATGSIGEGLSCEQIRLMDEVEFITDDSYCGERG